MRHSTRIVGQGFPDIAFTDWTFLSSAMVYFDAIGIPELPEPMSEETVQRMFGALQQAPSVRFVDPAGDRARYARLRETIHSVRALEDAGVVVQTQSGSGPLGPNSEAAVELTNYVLANIQQDSDLHVAASRATLWASQATGMRFSSPRGREPHVDQVFYVLEAIRRILDAAARSRHLVTNTIEDYRTLRQITALLPDQRVRTSPPSILELVRLSVPFLVGKSPEDVLAIREELREFLDPFRAEIAKIAASVQTDLNPSELLEEAHRAFDAQAQPTLVELRRFLESPGQVFLKHLVPEAKDIARTSVTIVVSCVLGAPLTASVLAAPVIHALGATLGAMQEYRTEKRSNPMTFAVIAEDRAATRSSR